MAWEKTNFRAQPLVRSIFVYRNGDAHADARRVLIQEKRVCDFETLLREVTGRVSAPFGAVRCIYTPRAGHRVDALEHVRHGEKYVAAGKERFKKLNYLQIGSRKQQTLQSNGLVKAAPQNRIVVSARFLKPIKEPCAIFIVANGDLLNPAVRVLVHCRLLNQYEQILETITEKMGLRILGGVRSLYSLEGVRVNDGKELDNGQFYVAVGRDKFKQLPYADSLFSKAVGMRRSVRSKAASLPPIYKYPRQNGDVVNGGTKSNPSDDMKSTVQVVELVRQISQARLMAFRKKRSNLSKSNSTNDNDDTEPKHEAADRKEKSAEDETPSAEQVCDSKENLSGEKEAAAEVEQAAGEEEAAAGEAAAGEEEAAAEEAAAGEEEAAAEEAAAEEAAAGEEEAAAEEAAAGEEEAAAEEEEAAAGEEEATAGEEEAAAEEAAAAAEEEAAEGAAAEEEEEAAGEEEAEAGEEAAEAEEAAAEEEEAAGEEEAQEEAAAD